MGSSGTRKTTMSKLARESKLRERRLEKQAKKVARKLASAEERDGTGADPTGAAIASADAHDPAESPGL
jgi:hypothetical protein